MNVIVNNAAIQGPIGPLEQNDFRDWEQTIRVNLLGPVAICRGLLSRMESAPEASILNLSGGGATGPRANFTAYASAKAALVRFSETLAEEVRRAARDCQLHCAWDDETAMLAEVLKGGAQRSGGREFAIAAKVFDEGGTSWTGLQTWPCFLAPSGARHYRQIDQRSLGSLGMLANHIAELAGSDVYTLRRIVGRDRG